MDDEFQDFEFLVSHGRSVPEWGWKNPWQGRATFKAVRLAYGGPIPIGMSIGEAFEAAATPIRLCAERKVHAAAGNISEPVTIDADDLMA